MEFSTLFFLYLFLPLSVAVYFIVPTVKAKNIILLLFSLLYYAFGQLTALPLLLLTALINYMFAKFTANNRVMLALTVLFDIACLVACKLISELVLPIGISFYTFSLVSYQVDVYRGKCEPSRSFLDFLLYVTMFPKLLLGPIVRYEQLQAQLTNRTHTAHDPFEGAVRFIVGLAKKVLIADYAYGVYEQFSMQSYGASEWLAGLMFMFYIYFEFSGCADMAIGLGRIFGFHYAENFKQPYCALSVTEFWRRWHITLGSFFRDYVYIPLGGSRKGRARRIFNLLVVWTLTGLWHGTSLNFLLWGLYFFVLLSIEKPLMKYLNKLPSAFRLLVTQSFVLFGWVLFSAESTASLWQTVRAMFGAGVFWADPIWTVVKNSLPLIVLCILGASALPARLGAAWKKLHSDEKLSCKGCLRAVGSFAFAVVLLLLCTASLLAAASKPSLYASF